MSQMWRFIEHYIINSIIIRELLKEKADAVFLAKSNGK